MENKTEEDDKLFCWYYQGTLAFFKEIKTIKIIFR